MPQADELARLNDDLADSPLTVTGSMGQPVPNGLLSESGSTGRCWSRCAGRSPSRHRARPRSVSHPPQRAAAKARPRGASLRKVREASDGRRRDEAAARLPLAEAVALAIETYPMPVGPTPTNTCGSPGMERRW